MLINKYICALVAVIMLFSFSSCEENIVNNTLSNESIEDIQTEFSDSGHVNDSISDDLDNFDYLNSFDTVHKEGDNYIVRTDDKLSGYYFQVYDDYGNLMDDGYHDYKAWDFVLKDGVLTYYNSSGSFIWYERYYDTLNGKVSRYYYRPLDTLNNLVAYYCNNKNGEIVLVICDMFDNSIYYHEYNRSFVTSVLTGGSEGEFSDDGSEFRVTYLIWDEENMKDVEVTEILDLNDTVEG